MSELRQQEPVRGLLPCDRAGDVSSFSSERRARIRFAEDMRADARSLSVSLDGVMVPLAQGEDGRSEGAWREASCGAVSFQDAQGRRRKTVYFGRMPEAGKATLKAEIGREVARIRELATTPTGRTGSCGRSDIFATRRAREPRARSSTGSWPSSAGTGAGCAACYC